MLLINFLCWLLIVVDVDAVHRGVGLEICTQARCKPDGPAIRFPFQLKGKQSIHCGYHGFDLSCTNDNEIVLKMPASSDNLFVERIDYTSQEIEIYYRSNHPPREFFDLSLSSSPLQFMPGPHNYNYTLFSCPYLEERLSYGFCLIKLGPYQLDNPENQTYAVNAQCSVDRIPLVSCTKLHDYTSIPDISTFAMKKIMKLHWSKPSCRHCEEMGKACRSKISEYSLAHVQTAESECLDLPEDHKNALISSFTVGALIIYHAYSSKKIFDKKNQLRIERFLEDYIAQKPSRYSYADIKRITNQFKDKLGQGAYGTVFKGKLSSELLVAVKILNNSNENREDFTNEMGTMGLVHHVNVVRLVGFCADGFIRALVYEFLPNGSLQNFLSSADNKNSFLGWDKLQDIALGIAKGIEYLHQGCDHRIIHFDNKPHNILLDQNFTPKVSDFGLAKLCSRDQSAISMTTVRGTMGYIAPEVFSRNFGNVSYKSDVYSFGTLLLEMVGGRKNFKVMEDSTSQVYFPEWIYNLLEQGDDLRIHIEDQGDAKIAEKLAIVGLWCVQWHPIDRPPMKNVVQMLEREGDNLAIPPNPFCSTSN
ncbi:rust resistance kinase Lr10-like [Prunus dulcis]|uniref:rust resistance kinase Lr10-like n=1 Tax=Prunus dulcis TaxID=3755 RepID=UPI00148357EB|nr:rust resistance kinase Lr10-like [Prunus dulcis]